jgi:hypothetical protein
MMLVCRNFERKQIIDNDDIKRIESEFAAADDGASGAVSRAWKERDVSAKTPLL